jgi:hypothetical protein
MAPTNHQYVRLAGHSAIQSRYRLILTLHRGLDHRLIKYPITRRYFSVLWCESCTEAANLSMAGENRPEMARSDNNAYMSLSKVEWRAIVVARQLMVTVSRWDSRPVSSNPRCKLDGHDIDWQTPKECQSTLRVEFAQISRHGIPQDTFDGISTGSFLLHGFAENFVGTPNGNS